MADTAIDFAAPLPFSNLDTILLPLLLGTGAAGSVAIQMLLAMPSDGIKHHIGCKEIETPAGRLRISLFNTLFKTNCVRSLSIGLTMRPGLGCIHGEVYAQDTVLPAAVCLAAMDRPLSALCETPDSFPGQHSIIRRIRVLKSSTRIRIEHEPAQCSLADLSPTAIWKQGARPW